MKNTFWALVVLMVISIVMWLLTLSYWNGAVLLIIGLIIIQGLFNIENRPPKFGLITQFNKKIWRTDGKAEIIHEGLNWIFLKGIIYDVLFISSEQRRLELNPQQILTPDNVDIKIPISIAWNVDESGTEEFINRGEDSGVDKHISDIIEGRLREYSRHHEEGPMSWKEMISSGLKTLDFLVKSLSSSEENPTVDGYDHLEKIHGSIPTAVLFDWYRKKNPSNGVVRKEYGDGNSQKDEASPDFNLNWTNLEKILSDEGTSHDDLKRKIQTRITLLEKLQRGDAKIKIVNSGAILKRLTIGDVSPSGEIYMADIALEKEQNERKSETYEIETDILKAEKLQEAMEKSGNKISMDEALSQIMKWKLIKDGKGFIYDGSLGNIAGIGNMITSIMKGKS